MNIIKEAIEHQNIVGLAVGVVSKDAIELIECHGVTSINQGIAMNKDTRIPPGSIAKVFCLPTVLRLVDQGLLDLDRPVIEDLDNFQFSDTIGDGITIRHLLSYSSGLPQSGKYWGPRDEDALKRYIYDELADHQFFAAPGEFHEYSNTAICLAGHICEQVTGTYYDKIVEEEVFGPLDMMATFDPVVAMTYPLALHHRRSEKLEVIHKMTRNNAGHPSSFVYTTLQSLINMAQMFLGKGIFRDELYLSSELIEQVFTPIISRQADYHNHPWLYQGYTLGLNYGHYRGKTCFRHGGLGLSSDSRFDLFVDDNVAFISYVNYYEGNSLSDIVMTGYEDILHDFDQDRYQSALAVITIESDHIIGTYHHKSSGRVVSIIKTDARYHLVQNNTQFELCGKDVDQFYYTIPFDPSPLNIPVIYTQGSLGSYIIVGGTPYLRIDHVLPVLKGELDEFCGIYHDSNNYNLYDRIEIRWNEELGLYQIKEIGHQNYTTVQKITDDEYTSDLGTLNFQDDLERKSFQLGYSARYNKIE